MEKGRVDMTSAKISERGLEWKNWNINCYSRPGVYRQVYSFSTVLDVNCAVDTANMAF
jgi:hypothetical protein